jgi:hypothetical protein
VREDTGSLIKYNASVILYNELIWNPDFSVSAVPLVDLHYNISVFNYCNINTYTSSGVERLLQAHHVPANRSWVAVLSIDDSKINFECMKVNKDLSWEELYILYWGKLTAKYIQSLGKY